MTSEATIRPVAPADRAPWLALWRDYLAFYRAPLDPDAADDVFRRLCATDGGVFGLVACAGRGEPVGFANAVHHASTWSAGGSCYLQDLHVHEASRGSDTGRALIEAVSAAAEARGAARLYWSTQSYNGRARSLYDTVGALTSFVTYERTLP